MLKAKTGPCLQDLVGHDVPIAAWCLNCGRHKLIPVEPLLTKVDSSTSVIALARRLTCRSCGGKTIETRPHYGSLGVVARHG